MEKCMMCFVLAGAILVILSSALSLEEGDQCRGSNKDKVCTKVIDCPKAMENIKKTKKSGLTRCGFKGINELVCCPSIPNVDLPNENQTHTRGSTTISKSKQACDEVTKTVKLDVIFHILGGDNASILDFPHMAALGYQDDSTGQIDFKCGGSLISNQYVLTAAHCIVSLTGRPDIIRLGRSNLVADSEELQGKDFGIANISVYPTYQRKTREHDIALLKLNETVPLTDNMKYACLYNREDDPKNLVVTGWGNTDVGGNPSPTALQKASISPVALSQCNETYIETTQRSLKSTHLCAVSRGGDIDTCQGDSGGPIQVLLPGYTVQSIVGVTSFGSGCGGTTPGVYTRVYSYIDWIESIVWP